MKHDRSNQQSDTMRRSGIEPAEGSHEDVRGSGSLSERSRGSSTERSRGSSSERSREECEEDQMSERDHSESER